MPNLTAIQQETLDFIKWHIKVHEYPPTRLNIATHFKIHPNAAQLRVKALERKEVIALSPGIARGIRVL